MSSISSSGLLKAFLRGALAASKPPISAPINKITLCIGNEAADADSIISSLCLAYLRHGQESQQQNCIVPVVSVNRKELALRRETEILLQTVNLELSDLVCLDELDLQSVDKIILVDHNSLAPRIATQMPPSASVKEIYDHHQDAGHYLHISPELRQIAFDGINKVATVGSTCTLVAEQYLASSSSSSSPSRTQTFLDSSISTLLLGVIALDTSNGDIAVGKATARDFHAMAALQPLAGVDIDLLYAKLRDAKMDISFWRSLSTEQCLLLDYKQQPIPMMCHGPELGVSSALLPLHDLVEKSSFAQQAWQYMEDQNLDMLGIMTFVLDPAPARQIAFLTRTAERSEQLNAYLTTGDTAASSLQLRSLELPAMSLENVRNTGLHLSAYRQENIKASRKQVLPLLTDFYGSIADSLDCH